MAGTTPFSTKDRILGAAEELFAQYGFAGTSLRQVTSRADVNIAAVNYHFGSKENLVNEVFRRRMDVMTGHRLQQLERALREHPGELELTIKGLHLLVRMVAAQFRLSGADEEQLRGRLSEILNQFTAAVYGEEATHV